MNKALGIFEGRVVDAAELKISGGSDDRVGTLTHGEQIFFIGKATISKITHEEKKPGYTRIHTATASSMVLLEKEDGERMLSEGQMMADERFGIANLFAQADATLGVTWNPDTGEIAGDDEEDVSQAHFIVADVLDGLKTLKDDSVDLVLTSPPFLALRSYLPEDHPLKDKEVGTEGTPGAFLDTLLDVVEECDRVLTPHGSLVFELGDTYAGSGGGGGDYLEGGLREGQPGFGGSAEKQREGNAAHWRKKNEWKKGPRGVLQGHESRPGGHHMGGRGWPLDKSLTGIPTLFTWSLAYGSNLLGTPCRECYGAGTRLGNAFTQYSQPVACEVCGGDGIRKTDPWRIRNLIVWCRPNPPVGALADKFRPASSYMTVACKSKQRWFDLDAVRHAPDPANKRKTPLLRTDIPGRTDQVMNPLGEDGERIIANANGAPPLDWWEITTQPYAGAHYATWPSALLTKPIAAMCPEKVCTTCGEPSRRIVERDPEATARNLEVRAGRSKDGRGDANGYDSYGGFETASTTTVGWSDCGHNSWRNGMVLDPFGGSGTTGAVASGLGRDCTMIDIDERNAELARERIGMFLTVED